jgi:hypothetical protein
VTAEEEGSTPAFEGSTQREERVTCHGGRRTLGREGLTGDRQRRAGKGPGATRSTKGVTRERERSTPTADSPT